MNTSPEQEASCGGVSLECDLGPWTKGRPLNGRLSGLEKQAWLWIGIGRITGPATSAGTDLRPLQAVIAHGALLQTVTQPIHETLVTHLVYEEKGLAALCGMRVGRGSGSISGFDLG